MCQRSVATVWGTGRIFTRNSGSPVLTLVTLHRSFGGVTFANAVSLLFLHSVQSSYRCLLTRALCWNFDPESSFGVNNVAIEMSWAVGLADVGTECVKEAWQQFEAQVGSSLEIVEVRFLPWSHCISRLEALLSQMLSLYSSFILCNQATFAGWQVKFAQGLTQSHPFAKLSAQYASERDDNSLRYQWEFHPEGCLSKFLSRSPLHPLVSVIGFPRLSLDSVVVLGNQVPGQWMGLGATHMCYSLFIGWSCPAAAFTNMDLQHGQSRSETLVRSSS